jgi:hypothetical protein
VLALPVCGRFRPIVPVRDSPPSAERLAAVFSGRTVPNALGHSVGVYRRGVRCSSSAHINYRDFREVPRLKAAGRQVEESTMRKYLDLGTVISRR